jgi:hypothetical protein
MSATCPAPFVLIFFLWRNIPHWVRASSFTRFLDHTQRRSTVGRTSLCEWSARRRDVFLTTHNNHNRQISMLPVGFEPIISAGEQPQTYAFDCAATGTGPHHFITLKRIMKSAFYGNSHCQILASFLSYPPSMFQMASSVRCCLSRCCSWGSI